MAVFNESIMKIKRFLGKPMGTPENLESGFDRRMSIIFPTKSPVNSLAGPPEETKVPRDIVPKFSGKFMKRLLESKKDLDDVYSNGYFENHYPEADKDLKQYLHEKTMSIWAKTLEKDYEEENSEQSAITIVVNVNK